jgi:hypothetical protein
MPVHFKRHHIATASVLAAGAFLLLLHSVTALAQGPACRCNFAQPPWEAYGTKALCVTYSRKGRTSCEVSFAGAGADMKIASQVLGIDPAQYKRDLSTVLGSFVEYTTEGRVPLTSSPDTLANSLLVLMRGAYVRGPLDDPKVMQSLDSAIKSFLEKYRAQVTGVFVGKDPPFKAEVNDARFDVGRGYIVIEHPAGTLITRYAPPG